MELYDNSIYDALKRVESFIGISRWLWVVNMVATVAGLVYGRYELAAVAGFTWVSALVATAIARAVARRLDSIRQTTQPSQSRQAA